MFMEWPGQPKVEGLNFGIAFVEIFYTPDRRFLA